MRFFDRLRDRLRDESGMSLIELMVAAIVCAVGIAATIGVMDQSRTVSVRSEYRDAMAHQAEREMERIMEMPWSSLGHGNSLPSDSPYAGTPSSGSFAYDRNDTTKTEALVSLNGDGLVQSSWTEWNDNQSRLSGRVYRFVTQINANARRVTVVISAAGANSAKPLLLSSIKTRPIT